MLKKFIAVVLTYILTLNSTWSSGFSAQTRIHFIKGQLAKIKNDAIQSLDFINQEISKIENLNSPYDHDQFSQEELTQIQDYLLHLKKVISQKNEKGQNILTTFWNWIVSASPYLLVGAILVGSLFFLGNGLLGNNLMAKNQNKQIKKMEYLKSFSGFGPAKISPCGKYVAYGFLKRLPYVYVADIKTKKVLAKYLQREFGRIYALTWSPDSHYIATGDDSGYIKIWNFKDAKGAQYDIDLHRPIRNVSAKNPKFTSDVLSISWSPKGNYIAVGARGDTINVFQVTDFQSKGIKHVKKIGVNSESPVFSVAWHPSEKYLVSGFKNCIRIFGIKTQKSVDQCLGGYHRLSSSRVSWSPKGNYIASASYKHNKITIWNLKYNQDEIVVNSVSTLESGASRSKDNTVYSMDWEPHENYLATGLWGGKLLIWDIQSKKITPLVLKEYKGTVVTVQWALQGNYFLSTTSTKVDLWNIVRR